MWTYGFATSLYRVSLNDDNYLYQLGYFIGSLSNLKALDALPYHTMGESKYEKLGMEYKLSGVPAMEKTSL